MPATPAALNLVDIFGQFGFIGLILVIWYLDNRRIQGILDSYKEDMTSIKQMYESNVSLVKNYERLAQDLHDVVIMNTQAMQKTFDAVQNNQFCPLNRIDTHKVKGGR